MKYHQDEIMENENKRTILKVSKLTALIRRLICANLYPFRV